LVGKFDKAKSLGATVAVLDDVSLDDLLVLEEGLETSIVENEGKVGDEEGRGRLGAVGQVARLTSGATSSWGLVVTSGGVGWGIGSGSIGSGGSSSSSSPWSSSSAAWSRVVVVV
jgi:hypothetical protein